QSREKHHYRSCCWHLVPPWPVHMLRRCPGAKDVEKRLCIFSPPPVSNQVNSRKRMPCASFTRPPSQREADAEARSRTYHTGGAHHGNSASTQRTNPRTPYHDQTDAEHCGGSHRRRYRLVSLPPRAAFHQSQRQ